MRNYSETAGKFVFLNPHSRECFGANLNFSEHLSLVNAFKGSKVMMGTRRLAGEQHSFGMSETKAADGNETWSFRFVSAA